MKVADVARAGGTREVVASILLNAPDSPFFIPVDILIADPQRGNAMFWGLTELVRTWRAIDKLATQPDRTEADMTVWELELAQYETIQRALFISRAAILTEEDPE